MKFKKMIKIQFFLFFFSLFLLYGIPKKAEESSYLKLNLFLKTIKPYKEKISNNNNKIVNRKNFLPPKPFIGIKIPEKKKSEMNTNNENSEQKPELLGIILSPQHKSALILFNDEYYIIKENEVVNGIKLLKIYSEKKAKISIKNKEYVLEVQDEI